jgi:hypothetical protein
MTNVKLVRYQMNPEANFGPQKKASAGRGTSNKRKEPDGGTEEA